MRSTFRMHCALALAILSVCVWPRQLFAGTSTIKSNEISEAVSEQGSGNTRQETQTPSPILLAAEATADANAGSIDWSKHPCWDYYLSCAAPLAGMLTALGIAGVACATGGPGTVGGCLAIALEIKGAALGGSIVIGGVVVQITSNLKGAAENFIRCYNLSEECGKGLAGPGPKLPPIPVCSNNCMSCCQSGAMSACKAPGMPGPTSQCLDENYSICFKNCNCPGGHDWTDPKKPSFGQGMGNCYMNGGPNGRPKLFHDKIKSK
jgi:hypothetical protein